MSAITAPADLQPHITHQEQLLQSVHGPHRQNCQSQPCSCSTHNSLWPFAQSLITTTADTSLQVCNQDAQPKFRQSTRAIRPYCPCTQQAHLPGPTSTQQQLSLPGLETPPSPRHPRQPPTERDLNGMCGTSRQLARVCCSALVEHIPGRGVTDPTLICLHPQGATKLPGDRAASLALQTCTHAADVRGKSIGLSNSPYQTQQHPTSCLPCFSFENLSQGKATNSWRCCCPYKKKRPAVTHTGDAAQDTLGGKAGQQEHQRRTQPRPQ